MKTLEYLRDPVLRNLFLPGIVTGLAIAVMCSCLSVIVVLKRLSFIGQGVSHAAFGGMGIAALLGVLFARAHGLPAEVHFSVVFAFCLGAALLIAAISDRRGESADTVIGIVLVASMTLGALLMHATARHQGAGTPAWESILFGSLNELSWNDARAAAAISAGVLAAAWWVRRPMLFWAFDEQAAPAFGVRDRAMKITLMVLLCLAIVTSMKLAGVVLATAILVLPGASALRLDDRLAWVIAWSAALSIAGVIGGIVTSFELNWPPGPSIVAVFTGLYVLTRLAAAVRHRRAPIDRKPA